MTDFERQSSTQSAPLNTLLSHLNATALQIGKVYERDLQAARSEIEKLRGKLGKHEDTESTDNQDVFPLKDALDGALGIIDDEAEVDYFTLEDEANAYVATEVSAFVEKQITEDSNLQKLNEPNVGDQPEQPDVQEDTHSDGALQQETHRDSFSARFMQYGLRNFWVESHDFSKVKLADMLEAEKKKQKHHPSGQRTDPLSLISMPSAPGFVVAIDHRIILHPEHKIRGFWVMACMALLLYDLIFLPVKVCFNLENTTFTDNFDFVAAVFWTLDIVLTFLTGYRANEQVEMHPSRIACNYMKSWFLFDLMLVVPEWMMIIVLSGETSLGAVAALRVLRWGRLMRLLRMVRLVKRSRLRPLIRHVALTFNLSRVYIQLTEGWLGLSILMLFFVHLLSCFWYAIGNSSDDGWVNVNHLESADAGRKYIVSVHWTFSRLYGLYSYWKMESNTDMLLDALLVYVSLILFAYYIGKAAALSVTRAKSYTKNLWKLSLQYSKKYHVSRTVQTRLFKFLESTGFAGAGEAAADELMLLESLPESLQHDLLYEARVRFLVVKYFFKDMIAANSRVVRAICTDTMTSRVFVDAEVVFSHGDACHWMLFITTGDLRYLYVYEKDDVAASIRQEGREGSHARFSSIRVSSMRSSRRRSTPVGTTRISKDSTLSEPGLWTNWIHQGRLVSVDQSMALTLEPEALADVLAEHKGSLTHAVRYAKRFVWTLNHSEHADDLVEFTNLGIADLDLELEACAEAGHFMFISHYKVEAGTEATLMRDLLGDFLRQDPTHPANDLEAPIFIDSEDLVDLAKLKEHVEMTVALVLLLTPGVLSRPWCLIEIVTAVKSNVNIVPVEIQRPGSSYRYPDDKYYADLMAGKILSKAAVDLLRTEGIELQDVQKAIRAVFLKIALPFSPHKTKTIREAELADILKRCVVGAQDHDMRHVSSFLSRTMSHIF